MAFALILAITAVLCVALADVIRKVPMVFYALAIIAVAVLMAGASGLFEGNWRKILILPVRRCMVAMALFTVVMYIGVLPKDSKLGIRMRTVRAELSIIAWILCLGHMCMYLGIYGSRALAGSLRGNVLASFLVALVLFLLLLVLGVTSFKWVKKHMHARTWKRVQLLAYPFFLLVYVHLMFMLAPSALAGNGPAVTSIAVYTIVFAAYLVLRLRRCVVDRKNALCGGSASDAEDTRPESPGAGVDGEE